MKIKKFNESENHSIEEYFYDLTENGDWIVYLIDNGDRLKYIHIYNEKIKNWFYTENDPLSNWGTVITEKQIEKAISVRNDQISSLELILKCVNHYLSSVNSLKFSHLEYKSMGLNRDGKHILSSYPVDTIRITLL